MLTVPRLEARRDALMEELHKLRETLRLEREAFELDFEHERQGARTAAEEAKTQVEAIIAAANEEAARVNQQLQARAQKAVEDEFGIESRLIETKSLESQAEQKLTDADQKLTDAAAIETKAKTIAEQTEAGRRELEDRWTELERVRSELEKIHQENETGRAYVNDQHKLQKSHEEALSVKANLLEERQRQLKQSETTFKLKLSELIEKDRKLTIESKSVASETERLNQLKLQLANATSELKRQNKAMVSREKRNLQLETDTRAEKVRVDLARENVRKLYRLIQEEKDARK